VGDEAEATRETRRVVEVRVEMDTDTRDDEIESKNQNLKGIHVEIANG